MVNQKNMSFFKSVMATVVGLVIAGLILMVFFVFGIIGLVASGSEEVPQVKENSILYINLTGGIAERIPEDPFAEVLGNDARGIELLGTLNALKHAKTDDNIKGIYMEHGFLSGGYASIEEIRDAIEDFKSSGKFVYSYAEFISEANYYVASVSDEIYFNPQGVIEFNGLSANLTFFKGLFDKLEVEPQIFRVGTYKSAVEPFMRKDMSEANREQVSSFINSIYDHYLKNVSESRGISYDQLKSISDSMLVRSPEDAFKHKLVTKIAYEDEIKTLIREQLGLEEKAKINSISLNNYIKTAAGASEYSSNKIAVIVAEGEIVSGKGQSTNVGSEKFSRAIKRARENDKVKAVVIRVNSPGGGIVASDVMWHEIMLTKAKKPVIASMSAVAASGGYYLSMPCDTIVAQPNTITGSIGIFGMMFNMGGFLENKLGITSDVVNTGEFSDIYTVSRSLNDFEKSIIQSRVEEGYDSFTSKAAEGRNMSIEDLKEVASGRVWTGSQAKERGLVDILGSYQDAINIAAAKAGIEDDYMTILYPELKSEFEEILAKLIGESEARFAKANYGDMAVYLDKIKNLENYKGIQARMPFDVTIQ
ncbi:MAG: protease-4 [Cyclobacteriaceae bacterium]|jgi:protease-4